MICSGENMTTKQPVKQYSKDIALQVQEGLKDCQKKWKCLKFTQINFSVKRIKIMMIK